MTATSPTVPASTSAYLDVKAAILDGEFPLGSMLSESQVAERVGVSRTPVREAFARLQSEGWLRVYPKRGALVVEPSANEGAEVLEARLLFEGHGVSRAIATGQHLQLADRLDTELAVQQQALTDGDHATLVHSDVDFHFHVMAASGNTVLTALSMSIRDRLERMAAQSFWRRDEIAQRAIDDHRELIAAIRAGNAEGYCALLDPHMTRTHEDLLR